MKEAGLELEKYYSNIFRTLCKKIKSDKLTLHENISAQMVPVNRLLAVKRIQINMEKLIQQFFCTTYENQVRSSLKQLGIFVYLDGFSKENKNIAIRLVKLNKNNTKKIKQKYGNFILAQFFHRDNGQSLDQSTPKNIFDDRYKNNICESETENGSQTSENVHSKDSYQQITQYIFQNNQLSQNIEKSQQIKIQVDHQRDIIDSISFNKKYDAISQSEQFKQNFHQKSQDLQSQITIEKKKFTSSLTESKKMNSQENSMNLMKNNDDQVKNFLHTFNQKEVKIRQINENIQEINEKLLQQNNQIEHKKLD